jgi:hypothetical protein
MAQGGTCAYGRNKVFNSLNDEIGKQEAVEPLTARLHRYAGVLTASYIGFWALYAGIRFLE